MNPHSPGSAGHYLKRDYGRPTRVAPQIPPKPVGLVSRCDSLVITATTSRGIDPSTIRLPQAIARPAYSVPSDDPPTNPPPTIIFPPQFSPRSRDLQLPSYEEMTSIMPKDPEPIAPLASISETETGDRVSVASEVIVQVNELQPTEELIEEERIVEQQIHANEDENDRPTPKESENFTQSPIAFPATANYSRMPRPFSKCSLILGLLFVIFFLGCIGIFIGWAVTSDGFSNLGGLSEVCSTKECIDSAFRVSTFMDESIPACTNFYRHSCGKFHAQNMDKQLDYTTELEENTLRDLFNVVNNIHLDDSSSKSTRFAKELFDSCMNETARREVNGKPLIELLRNLPCGPIFSECHNFNADHYSWERHAGMTDWYAGDYNLIVVDREIANENDRTLRLSFRPPSLTVLLAQLKQDLLATPGMHETEFEAVLAVAIRQNLLTDVVSRQLMTDPKSGDRQKMMQEVAELMVEVDNSTRHAQPSRTILPMRDFFNMIPQINMTEFLIGDISSFLNWSEADTVVVYDMSYFEELAMIVARHSRRSVANYLLLATAQNVRPYVLKENEELSWKNCARQTSQLDPYGKLYIETRTNVSLPQIGDFTRHLLNDFVYFHRHTPTTILSQTTRINIGFPGKILSEEFLYSQFQNVYINNSDYFHSVTTALKHQKNAQLALIGSILDEDDSTAFSVLRPTIVHSVNENTLTIPISVLQEPLVMPGAVSPQLSVYGTYGVVVSQLLAKVLWESVRPSVPADCIRDVFQQFLDPMLQPMDLTLFRKQQTYKEDILQTVVLSDALTSASLSYSKWQKQSGIHQEQNLPVFRKMKSIEEFFVMFGNTFCGPEGFRIGSLYEARINTAAAISDLFHAKFECKKDAPMFYAQRKCFQPFIQE